MNYFLEKNRPFVDMENFLNLLFHLMQKMEAGTLVFVFFFSLWESGSLTEGCVMFELVAWECSSENSKL